MRLVEEHDPDCTKNIWCAPGLLWYTDIIQILRNLSDMVLELSGIDEVIRCAALSFDFPGTTGALR